MTMIRRFTERFLTLGKSKERRERINNRRRSK